MRNRTPADIYFLAKAREVDIYTGRGTDANIYLTKPLHLLALVVQVGTLLEEERRDV